VFCSSKFFTFLGWKGPYHSCLFQDNIPAASDAELAGLDVECDALAREVETIKEQMRAAEGRLKQFKSSLTLQVGPLIPLVMHWPDRWRPSRISSE
jgi:hypothetical protein